MGSPEPGEPKLSVGATANIKFCARSGTLERQEAQLVISWRECDHQPPNEQLEDARYV